MALRDRVKRAKALGYPGGHAHRYDMAADYAEACISNGIPRIIVIEDRGPGNRLYDENLILDQDYVLDPTSERWGSMTHDRIRPCVRLTAGDPEGQAYQRTVISKLFGHLRVPVEVGIVILQGNLNERRRLTNPVHRALALNEE